MKNLFQVYFESISSQQDQANFEKLIQQRRTQPQVPPPVQQQQVTQQQQQKPKVTYDQVDAYLKNINYSRVQMSNAIKQLGAIYPNSPKVKQLLQDSQKLKDSFTQVHDGIKKQITTYSQQKNPYSGFTTGQDGKVTHTPNPHYRGNQ